MLRIVVQARISVRGCLKTEISMYLIEKLNSNQCLDGICRFSVRLGEWDLGRDTSLNGPLTLAHLDINVEEGDPGGARGLGIDHVTNLLIWGCRVYIVYGLSIACLGGQLHSRTLISPMRLS